jgi:hypothetical protein
MHWFLLDLKRIGVALFGLGPAIAKCVRNVVEAIQIILTALITALFLLLVAVILWSISEAWRYGIGIAVYEVAYGTQVMVDAIIKAIDALESIFTSHRIKEVYYANGIEEFKHPSTCDPFDSYEAVVFYMIRLTFSRHVCPAMRYVYGTPLKTLAWPFVRPFSFDPEPERANCHEPQNAEYCVWFIELWRLPAMAFLGLCIISVAGPLMPLILQTIRIADAFVILFVQLAWHALRELMFRLHPHTRHGKHIKPGSV